jgi:hypothetical protein
MEPVPERGVFCGGRVPLLELWGIKGGKESHRSSGLPGRNRVLFLFFVFVLEGLRGLDEVE